MNSNSKRNQSLVNLSSENNNRTESNTSKKKGEDEEINFPPISSNKEKNITQVKYIDEVSTNRTARLLGKKTKIFEIKKDKKKQFKNRDDSIKGALKAPIPFLMKLAEQLGGEKLKLYRVNLNLLTGGMDQNRKFLKMTFKEILKKNEKNITILQNVMPKYPNLFNRLLSSSYIMLFNKYYNNDKKIMGLDEKDNEEITFPTFNEVLKYRNERYYHNDQNKIKWFNDATQFVSIDFDNEKGRIRTKKNYEKIEKELSENESETHNEDDEFPNGEAFLPNSIDLLDAYENFFRNVKDYSFNEYDFQDDDIFSNCNYEL